MAAGFARSVQGLSASSKVACMVLGVACLLGTGYGDPVRTEVRLDIESWYLDGEFSTIVDRGLPRSEALERPDRLRIVESLARTGRSSLADEAFADILRKDPQSPPVLAVSGWIQFSRGRLQRALELFDTALNLSPDLGNALLGKVLLLLYLRRFDEAAEIYRTFLAVRPGWATYQQAHLVGVELFWAMRDARGLYDQYSRRSQSQRRTNKALGRNTRSTAKLFKSVGDLPLNITRTAGDVVRIPLIRSEPPSGHLVLELKVEGKVFRVVLDTGNATGWMVHSRDLHDQLGVKRGGRTVAMIGTEAKGLDGYYIMTKSLPLPDAEIRNLPGIYVPKPYPDFYDANLNPLFIQDRIVTIDFSENQLVLRTPEAFSRDFTGGRSDDSVVLPWFGYEQAYVPVRINGERLGLALVETGAEDMALQLDVASELGLPLTPRRRYLANGQVYDFSQTAVVVSLDRFLFARKQAEVWPFDRFFNRLSGLRMDVVLGPAVFSNQFSITFHPFSSTIILRRHGV